MTREDADQNAGEEYGQHQRTSWTFRRMSSTSALEPGGATTEAKGLLVRIHKMYGRREPKGPPLDQAMALGVAEFLSFSTRIGVDLAQSNSGVRTIASSIESRERAAATDTVIARA